MCLFPERAVLRFLGASSAGSFGGRLGKGSQKMRASGGYGFRAHVRGSPQRFRAILVSESFRAFSDEPFSC